MNAKYSLIKPTPSHQLCSRSVARRAERNPMNYAHHPTLPLESAMSCFFNIVRPVSLHLQRCTAAISIFHINNNILSLVRSCLASDTRSGLMWD